MMNWDTYVTLLDMEQKEKAEKDKGDKKMNNINFYTMTDDELQNLIEQAGKEQDNRIREKRKIAEQTFWRVARELCVVDPDYELYDTGSYVFTIKDLIFEHEAEDID